MKCKRIALVGICLACCCVLVVVSSYATYLLHGGWQRNFATTKSPADYPQFVIITLFRVVNVVLLSFSIGTCMCCLILLYLMWGKKEAKAIMKTFVLFSIMVCAFVLECIFWFSDAFYLSYEVWVTFVSEVVVDAILFTSMLLFCGLGIRAFRARITTEDSDSSQKMQEMSKSLLENEPLLEETLNRYQAFDN